LLAHHGRSPFHMDSRPILYHVTSGSQVRFGQQPVKG
jgi:hypothetical protein